MVLWFNSTKNLNLVEQVVKKLSMKDIVISKLPKLGEAVEPRIHLFPRNYTHNLTLNYTFVFTPGYHKTTNSRPSCENANVQARKHMQERTNVCAGSTHRQAHMDASLWRGSRTHTRSHTYAQVRMHARRSTRTLIRVGARAHTHTHSRMRRHTRTLV